MTCNVTGILYAPDGTVCANQVVTFTRKGTVEAVIDGGATKAIIPKTITAMTDGTGAIDVDLFAGPYDGYTSRDNGRDGWTFSVGVPQDASALIGDIISQAADYSGITNEVTAAATSASDSADLSAAWAKGTEPGGAGTMSAKEHALDSAASAAQAALFDGPWFDDVQSLLEDTSLTYTVGSPSSVSAGEYVQTRSGFSYQVAAPTATDQNETTQGGVKLYRVGFDQNQLDRMRGQALTTFRASTARHILFVGDSTTEGAGVYGTPHHTERVLRGTYGDGGAGYRRMQSGHTDDEFTDQFVNTSNFGAAIDTLDATTAPAIYSPDLHGQYSSAFVSGKYLVFGPERDWDNLRLFYIKQPGGAQFKCDHSGFATGSYRYTVDANAALGIGYVDIVKAAGGDSRGKLVWVADGVLTIPGYYTWRDNDAPIVSRFAHGGETAQHFAGLSLTGEYFTALSPDVAIVNLGMNDRLTRTAAQILADVQTYVSYIPAGTDIVLVAPNSPADDASSALPEYRKLLRRYALANGHAFVDLTEILGSYDTANAGGDMQDGVHPSAQGFTKCACAILETLGFHTAARRISTTPFQAIGGATKIWSGNLSDATDISVASLATTQLYELGAINGAPMGHIEIEISARSIGSAAHTVSKHWIMFKGGTVTGQIVSVLGSVATEEKARVDTGYVIDLTVSASIVGNHLVISVANNSSGGTAHTVALSATAKYQFSYLTQVGQSIYEY